MIGELSIELDSDNADIIMAELPIQYSIRSKLAQELLATLPHEKYLDENGNLIEIHCTYDPKTKGGWSNDGRKVRGTLNWVSAKHAKRAEVRLYDYLFKSIESEGGMELIPNSNSLETLRDCWVEPSLVDEAPGHRFQFERLGYFCMDTHDSSPTALVFNRTVTLRDTWSKIQHR